LQSKRSGKKKSKQSDERRVRAVPWFEALGVGVVGWLAVALAVGIVIGRISRKVDRRDNAGVISERRTQ
jgi:hypothetical protein